MNGPGVGQSVQLIAPSGAAVAARVRDSDANGNRATLLLGLDPAPVALLADRDVSVEFTNSRGVCRMPGTARVTEGGAALRVEATGVIELIQRRDFVRVEAFIPVTYQPLGPEGWTVTAHTLDVSGGGFRIAAAEALRLGDMMSFTLELSEGEEPLRAVAVAAREAGDTEFGMRFVEILERERQRLVRWVFERERIARQIARHK